MADETIETPAASGQQETPASPQAVEKPGDSYVSIREVLAEMAENPEPAETDEGGETPEEKPEAAEAKPEEKPEEPADDTLESERIAREESEAYRLRRELEEQRAQLEALQREREEVGQQAAILDRLRKGENPQVVLKDAGIEWKDFIAAAVKDPARAQAESETAQLRQQLEALQKTTAQLLQDQGKQKDIEFARSKVSEHADRWPQLAGHTQAGEAIAREFYASGGQKSFEAIADELETALTAEKEQADWKASPEYQAWQKRRSGGQPATRQSPGGEQPRPAATQPRETPTSTPAPQEAAGKEEDPWDVVARHLGRPAQPHEVRLYVTRGVLP